MDQENLKKQQDLLSKNGKRSEIKEDVAAKKKKKSLILQEKEEEFLKRDMVHVPIPDALKLKLVQDWENVTKSQKLVTLPRNPTVNQILNEFLNEYLEKEKSKKNQDIVKEVVEGLKIYFNKALGTILLYKLEKMQ
jgi:mortality factor 4-like protein 1